MELSGHELLHGGDLPAPYGDWQNTHRRFCRWRDKGVWEDLLEILIDEPDFEWHIIDATHCKAHAHAAGAQGGNDGLGCTKRVNTKLHVAVDAHGMPVRILAAEGTRADCSQARHHVLKVSVLNIFIG